METLLDKWSLYQLEYNFHNLQRTKSLLITQEINYETKIYIPTYRKAQSFDTMMVLTKNHSINWVQWQRLLSSPGPGVTNGVEYDDENEPSGSTSRLWTTKKNILKNNDNKKDQASRGSLLLQTLRKPKRPLASNTYLRKRIMRAVTYIWSSNPATWSLYTDCIAQGTKRIPTKRHSQRCANNNKYWKQNQLKKRVMSGTVYHRILAILFCHDTHIHKYVYM